MIPDSNQKTNATPETVAAGRASQGAPRSEPALSQAGCPRPGHTRLLLLPDGRVLVHNLTPAMARILQKLDPEDRLIQKRALSRNPASSVTDP